MPSTRQSLCVAFATIASLFLSPQTQGEVKLATVFADHMVLQQGKPVPVWGWSDAGDGVTVEFGGQKRTARAGKDGKWTLVLGALEASKEPRTMAITSATGGEPMKIEDILVGEVWVCSGQSNMAWAVNGCRPLLQPFIDEANTPVIRHLRVDGGFEAYPKTDVQSGAKWQVCSPKTVGGFTAVGYFFARMLHQETGLPIGLLNSSVGGTRIEPWTPPVGFAGIPELKAVNDQVRNAEPQYRQKIGKTLAEVEQWLVDTRKALAEGGEVYAPHVPTHPLALHSRPTMLYNGKIHGLVPYAIRGAIWYQGEANGGEGVAYYHKMQALISGWRKVWRQGEFPFYFVQLANWRQPNADPAGGDGWAKVRMAQLKSLAIKNTGMAVAIELADAHNPNDIHPRNKKDVGERLARWALAKDYGKELVYSGPLYKSLSIKGNLAVVEFDSVGTGLMAGQKEGLDPVEEVEDGELKGFALSDGEGQWHWATAKIEGQTVVVSSPEVTKPVAVRYAYTMNPVGCNLYNREGLPASPFTTDEHWTE